MVPVFGYRGYCLKVSVDIAPGGEQKRWCGSFRFWFDGAYSPCGSTISRGKPQYPTQDARLRVAMSFIDAQIARETASGRSHTDAADVLRRH